MRGNIITVKYNGRTRITAPEAWQYDYGLKLKIVGVELPSAYEVHFAWTMHHLAITQIGDETGVIIPDEFLERGSSFYAWLYLHTTDADGETELQIHIPVARRAVPSYEVPDEIEHSVITQTIAALNDAVGRAEEVAQSIGNTIGDMAELVTDDKSSLVAAINEACSKGGSGGDIATNEEVADMLDDVFQGITPTPGGDGKYEIATDSEVEDMINGVFQ